MRETVSRRLAFREFYDNPRDISKNAKDATVRIILRIKKKNFSDKQNNTKRENTLYIIH